MARPPARARALATLADVRAGTEVRLLRIGGDDLQRLLGQSPSLASSR